MRLVSSDGPLFQWASCQEIRRPVATIVRRVAMRARISNAHAAAFIEANRIAPEASS